jgi:hypothetical protein
VIAAHAADRIYWGEGRNSRLGFISPDGSGSGSLAPTGITIGSSEGTAIDPVSEKIYWLNNGIGGGPVGIAFASLNGSEAGTLTITGAEFNESSGLAIDPIGRRIYWANEGGGTAPATPAIWSANIENGTDLKQFNTSPATLKRPSGLALDPIARRLYWINSSVTVTANPVSFASLDDPGHGENLQSTGAPFATPSGLAVDPIGGRVYWANLGASSISVAKLNGTGGEQLDTTGADVNQPRGIAVDPFAGRVYVPDAIPSEGPLSFANSDGSGHGGNINHGALSPTFPVLRVSPRSTAPPQISGETLPGSTLTCSKGTWSPDLVSAFFYDAAKSFSFQWSRNGAEIPGANGETLKADAEGDYRCAVSAKNESGSTVAMSAPHRIEMHPSSTSLSCAPSTLTLGGGQATCTATVADPAPSPSAPSGVVKFSAAATGAFANGSSCTLAVASGGKASCQIAYTPKAAGPDKITAAYQGDSRHHTSEGTSSLAVSAKSHTGPPNTTIKNKPRAKSASPLATFSFTADQPGSSFQCKLDKGKFKPCHSPFKRKVKPGRHSFQVRGVSSAGVTDPTPASYRWRVSG